MPRHIRKGDEVMIRAGDHKGATGTVMRIITKHDRVVVSGPRIEGITKNQKPSRINPQGGRVTVDRSFHISNVSPLIDGKATRVRFETRDDGSKVRVAVHGGKSLKDLGVIRSATAKGKTAKPKTPKAPKAPKPVKAEKPKTEKSAKPAKTTKKKKKASSKA